MKEQANTSMEDELLARLYSRFKDRILEEIADLVMKECIDIFNCLFEKPISLHKAAEALNMSKGALYKKIERGSVICNKNGGRYSIALSDLKNQLANGKSCSRLDLPDNQKSSKAKSGDSAGEAFSED